jgi:hypothetical protein
MNKSALTHTRSGFNRPQQSIQCASIKLDVSRGFERHVTVLSQSTCSLTTCSLVFPSVGADANGRRNDRVLAGDQFEDERRKNAADHRRRMRFITSAPAGQPMIGTGIAIVNASADNPLRRYSQY